MKKRNGFISNSSSSSFVIYGVSLDQDEMINLAKQKFSNNDKINKALENFENEPWEFEEALYSAKLDNLKIISNTECEVYYIGREFKNIGDNETGKQFKDSIEEEISKLGILNKCKTIDIEIHC